VRLADAANQLSGSVLSITAVAFDAGYESSQAFARAFRRFASMTPGDFRNLQRSLAEERLTRTAANPVRIVDIPAFEVVCVPHQGSIMAIPLTFRELRRLHHGRTDLENAPPVGVIFHDQEGAGEIRYFAGLRTQRRTRCTGVDAEIRRVGGGRYAALQLRGPYALIAPTFRTLIEKWLPRNGFYLDQRPALELYHNGLQVGKRCLPTTELLLPIA
jgi:AraC family transcriptional regulator